MGPDIQGRQRDASLEWHKFGQAFWGSSIGQSTRFFQVGWCLHIKPGRVEDLRSILSRGKRQGCIWIKRQTVPHFLKGSRTWYSSTLGPAEAFCSSKGGMETSVRVKRSLNIEEEYNNTLLTQWNARFLSKKQQSEEEMEVLHDSHQDLISPMLQDMVIHRRTSSEIELAMAGYFDASAEASEMCRQLLRSIKSTQSNYQSMDSFLASMSGGVASTSAREPVRSNPFCTMTRSNFRQIHDRHSSILQSIRASHRRVTRKLGMVKAVKKLSRTCVVMVCGAAAIGAAAHLLFFGLLIVPAAAGLCPAALKRRLVARTVRELRRPGGTTSLVRLREQLDAAAKGTYVLSRDLDTVSHLVARLSDGIERENAMARRCAERAGERCPVQEMVGELRRSCSSSRRLADELEEHVYLCLATIHRLRLLVMQEISKQTWL